MISPHSPWLSAHGKLWYDDKWYRYAWILWPQALAAVLVMWFWAMPSNRTATAQWAKPLDSSVRYQDLLTLRNAAKSSQPSMDALERDAHGGEMDAQFFLGTLYDPDLELSTIVAPDFAKAVEWYDKAASQGQQYALNNLALFYSRGVFTRVDYTRACYYALKLNANATGNGMTVKGDCYARGLGGTKLDPAQAASAYQAAPKGAQPSPAPSVPAPSPAAPSPPTPVPLIPGPAPASPTELGRSAVGSHWFCCRRFLFHGLEDALTTGGRSRCRQAMRSLWTRRLPGREHFRTAMRRARYLYRKLCAAALAIVLYRRWRHLSRGPGRLSGPLQCGRTHPRPLPVPDRGLRRRAIVRAGSSRPGCAHRHPRRSDDTPPTSAP